MPWKFQQLNDHCTYWWALLWQLRLMRLLTIVLSIFYNHIINLEDFSAPFPPFKQLQRQFMIKRVDSLWLFTSKGHGKVVGGWEGVIASSWVNLHWYREIWVNLFRINPLGENIEGSIQTTVLKQNEHLFPRHNYNCQGRKFFQNHLISEMGNKLVSLVGISTLVQLFIANLSMTQTHQIHQVSPFSHNKNLLRLWGSGKLCACNICSSLSPVQNLRMCWKKEPWKLRIFIFQVLRCYF